jgi:hypothetical protein
MPTSQRNRAALDHWHALYAGQTPEADLLFDQWAMLHALSPDTFMVGIYDGVGMQIGGHHVTLFLDFALAIGLSEREQLLFYKLFPMREHHPDLLRRNRIAPPALVVDGSCRNNPIASVSISVPAAIDRISGGRGFAPTTKR